MFFKKLTVLLLLSVCSFISIKSQTDLFAGFQNLNIQNDYNRAVKLVNAAYEVNDSLTRGLTSRVITRLKTAGKNDQAALLILLSGQQEARLSGDTGRALAKFRECEGYFFASNNFKLLVKSIQFQAEIYGENNQISLILPKLLRVLKQSDNFPEEKFLISSSLGTVFKRNENIVKAKYYFDLATQTYNAISEKNNLLDTRHLSNLRQIGVLFRDQNKYDSAEKYFSLSMHGAEQLNNEQLMSSNLNSLAGMYSQMGQVKKAIELFLKSIALKRTINNGKGLNLATSLANVADLYLQVKNVTEAEKCLAEAEKITLIYKDRKVRISVLRRLRKLYEQQNDKTNLLKVVLEINDLQEGMYKEEVAEQTAKMEAVYQNEKKSMEIADANLKNTSLKKDLAYKERERKIFITGGALLLALLAIAFKMYIEVRKGNKKLNIKNEQINSQKIIVEHQNKEIIDSINYAQKIQKALLPSEADFQNSVGESFVIFKPKDIVSGDFYWCSEKEGYTFYATVDCTGHGVPGGFMSMLATSLLTEVIIEKSILQPGVILNLLRDRIIFSLKQKGLVGENKDGMDMTLCRINKERTELVVAAANNPMWVLREGSIFVFKADKMPVGYSPVAEKTFSEQSVPLKKGDVIYTFTDGYADQFGGPNGKKFKYKQLSEYIISIGDKQISEQKKLLEEKFNSWRGSLEQLDDVCVIGVRV